MNPLQLSWGVRRHPNIIIMQTLDRAIHAKLRALASRHELESHRDAARLAPDLLPLYLDWVGFIGLADDGEVRFVNWDPPHTSAPVREPYLVRAALVAGAEQYAELAALRPVRPANAVDCVLCGGTGRPTIEGQPVPDNIRCFCGGLGWLLPGETEQASRP
jgi:hypothetical protein